MTWASSAVVAVAAVLCLSAPAAAQAPGTWRATGVAAAPPGGEQRDRPILKGAAWGAAAGAGTGLALALGARGEFATYCAPDDPPGCFPQPGTRPPIDWWSVPVMAGVGAGIGTVIGALLPGKPGVTAGEPGDSLRNGILIGAITGAGLGMASCAANPQCVDDEGAPAVTVGLGLMGTAAGAGIGALVDALIKPAKPPVLRVPGPGAAPHARVSVSPVLSPRAKGAAVSFMF